MQQLYDAQAALGFVQQQGRNIETKVYQQRYTKLDYARHVPVVTEGNPWAIGTEFYMEDYTGEAKFISGSATDMPYASVTQDQGTHDFYMIGAGWEWNLEEVQQSMLYNRNISDRKAMAATQNVERKLHTIAMTGADEKGWKGLVNSTAVARADVAADGTSSSTFWTAKTTDLILRDVNDALGKVEEDSNEVEWADTLRLPPEAFRYIATKRLGDGDGQLTILKYLEQNNVYTAETGQPLDIAPLRELATASSDGGGRMLVYRKDPEVLRFHLPMPRRVVPVHQKSLMGFHQGMIARTGGVEIRLPKAMAYLDEITAVPS